MKIKSLLSTLNKCHSEYVKSLAKPLFLAELSKNRIFKELTDQVDDLSLTDLGIQNMQEDYYFGTQGTSKAKIKAASIVDTEQYAVIIFFLSKGSWMPLHGHPDMAVYTRILGGNIRYRALDLEEYQTPAV